MKKPHVLVGMVLFILMMTPLGFALGEGEEDVRSAGCLPKLSLPNPASVCAGCHQDSQKRWTGYQFRPCTEYCMTCHKTDEISRHHTVGTLLPKLSEDALHLTSERKMACMTCHDLSRARFDKVRWKSTSLFDRLFHQQSKYNTYFLSMRNDQGQLCLYCH